MKKMDTVIKKTTYRQRVCSLLLLMILLTVGISRLSAQTYSGGSGTSDDPYRISTVGDLNTLAAQVSADLVPKETYFRMTDDIDMSGVTGFTPIGSPSHPFKGYFDGDRKTILNLTINLPENDDVGMFGYVTNGGTVNNLNLVNVEITGHDKVGGLVGEANNTATMSTNTVSGKITGRNYVGAVLGYGFNEMRVQENTVTADVKGTGQYVGGVAGWVSTYSAISFNVFAGRLQAVQSAGGIAGYISAGSVTSTMAANLSEGDISVIDGSSYSNIGAVVGETEGTVTIKNNFYDKQMLPGFYGMGGTTSDVDGQIMGKLTSEALNEGLRVHDAVSSDYSFDVNHYTFTEGRYPYITNSPNDKIALAAAAPAILRAESSTDYETIKKIKSAFTVCLDRVTWKSSDTTIFEVGYYGAAPLQADASVDLIALVDNIPIRYVTLHFASESEGFHVYGSRPNPIMISSVAELNNLRDATNNKTTFKGVSGANGFAGQYFIQTTNLVYKNQWNPISGQNVWMPVDAWNTSIGCDASHPFKGNYDGQNHSITNFVVFSDGSSSSTTSYPLADYRGLFGYMEDASVENLHLAGGVYAKSYVGLMAGYAKNTTFTNCSMADYVGNSQNQIKASGSYVGGFLGKGFHVTIENCNNNVNVQAASILGGVAGSLTDTSHVSFSNNTGEISATSGESTAGIVGILGEEVGFCTIDNCNNSSAVTGYGYVAGIAAKVNPGTDVNDRDAAIRHCANTAHIKGNTYVGGIIGYGRAVKVEYCTVSNVPVTSILSYVGGIAAWLTYNPKKDATYPDTSFSILNHCSSAAQITTEQSYAGGIAGGAEYVKDIHDLSNEGASVISNTTTSGYFGGFFGSTNRLNLKNLTNKATVTASTDYNGGIIGWGDIWTYIDSCRNEAAVTGKTNTGGLVGRTEGYTSITNSDNEGAITGLGGDHVGGVMGCLYGVTKSGFKGFYVHNLTNNGVVTGTSYVGGVIACLDGHGRYNNKVTKLKNNAPVSGNSYVGGVFGSAVRYVYMDTLENRGEVNNTVGSYTGGIGGQMGNTNGCFDTLKHAVNYAPVNGMGYVAGIVAAVSDGDNVNLRGEWIDSCENHGAVTAKGDYVGGLIGATHGSTISNSHNDGPLNSTVGYLGGLIGYAGWTWRVNTTYTDTAYCILENLTNDADMESNSTYTGGAVGYADYCDIRNLTNNGKVIGMSTTGGLFGRCNQMMGQPLSSSNCHVGANVTVQGYETVGGLVGSFYYGTVRDYENHAKVTSDDKNGFAGSSIGGVAGYANGRIVNGDTIPVKFINVKNYIGVR